MGFNVTPTEEVHEVLEDLMNHLGKSLHSSEIQADEVYFQNLVSRVNLALPKEFILRHQQISVMCYLKNG